MILIAAGASSLLAIGRQEDPTITNLFANVTTAFPGASPERVETLVTTEIETAVKEIPEVDTITSSSGSGISIIAIELVETIDPSEIENIWSEVRDAVSEAETKFPAGVQPPEVDADGISAYAAILSLSLERDEIPLTIAGRYADEIADRLRNIPGTKQVELFGKQDEEVLVTVDRERASALGVTAQDVSSAILAADAKVRAGRLNDETSDFLLEVNGEIDTINRLRSVVIRTGDGTTATRLYDIATIERGAKTPYSEMTLTNGSPSILIAATLEDGLQVDVWSEFVRSETATFQDMVPTGLKLELIFDQSIYTADRLSEVGLNMAIGVGLVIAVLLITLGIRAALIVAIVLPIVSLASIATMNFLGLAIHQMSVTGLIVALGLLVDAGIVMTDEIARRIREGAARISAVSEAVKRLGGPLFASTATTALSFTPMILLPGPAGDFVGSIAIAVVIMLIWSLIIALTVTPAIAGWVMPEQGKTSFFNSGISGGPLGKLFALSLKLAVKNPVRTMAISLIVPVLGFVSMPTLTAQFFPGVDRDQFFIEFDMPAGTSINQTRSLVDRIDSILAQEAQIKQTYWSIGRSGPAFYYNITGGRDNAPGYAQAFITTESAAATEELINRLERTLADEAPMAQVLVRGLVQGPPVSSPLELRIVGQDIDTLRSIGDELQITLSHVETITLARTTQAGGAPKVVVDVDEAKARALGLNLGVVAAQLEASLEGTTGGSLVEGTEQLPVRVRLGDDVRGDLSAIRDLPISAPSLARTAENGGFASLPLSAIADISLEPADGVINRRNGERINTVQGFILRSVLPEEALKVVQAKLDENGFSLPAGYRLELGGDSDARSNTLGNLLASVGLIVTLTITTIVLTFNSFRLAGVTLVVCILSAGLSIFALAVFQYPFGINAILGVIGSIGVSINAAIIIMTGLQADEGARHADPDAVVAVLMNSSRHIVSTTITTFGGFLPLILAGGGFWPPFAMAIAGGVLLSTIVSFYFTPPAFLLVYAKKPRNSVKEDTIKRAAEDHTEIDVPEPKKEYALAAE